MGDVCVCRFCGKEFVPKAGAKGAFCSRTCGGMARRLPPATCARCGGIAERRRTYCSLECAHRSAATARTSPMPADVPGAKWIPLTRGFFAIVDDRDYAQLVRHSWSAHVKPDGKVYAGRTVRVDGRKSYVLMHRVVLDAASGANVDHRNGDGLDNRRLNLRIATQQENCRNRLMRRPSTSKFKGVALSRTGWVAAISVDRRTRYIGTFASDEDAARAYDAEARRLFGDFARVNFPRDGELPGFAERPTL